AEREEIAQRSRLQELENTEQRIAESLAKVDEKIGALRSKRKQLASREAQAQAVRAVNRIDGGTEHDIDALFERWESRIDSLEPMIDATPASDSFQERFEKTEQTQELRQKLEKVVREKVAKGE